MNEWIKDHFIPHKDNGYQPHFLRLRVAAGMLGLIFAIEALYLMSSFVLLPRSDSFAAIFASVLVEQTNKVRKEDNLGDLIRNPYLEKAAQMKAEDMAAKGYFAHDSPDGKTPWYWFDEAGYDYAVAGENLAVNFTDSKDVTEAWLRSPSHRANIMSGKYTEIGIATARGTYKGKEAIFVVQEFGRPGIIARQIIETNNAVTALGSLANSALSSPAPVATKITQKTSPANFTPSRVIKKPTQPKLDIQVAKTETPKVGSSTVVAGAETARLSVPVVLMEKSTLKSSARKSGVYLLLASPRYIATSVYLLLAGILLLALFLAVFIKLRIQFPHIIANGALLVAIIFSIILINSVLGVSQGFI